MSCLNCIGLVLRITTDKYANFSALEAELDSWKNSLTVDYIANFDNYGKNRVEQTMDYTSTQSRQESNIPSSLDSSNVSQLEVSEKKNLKSSTINLRTGNSCEAGPDNDISKSVVFQGRQFDFDKLKNFLMDVWFSDNEGSTTNLSTFLDVQLEKLKKLRYFYHWLKNSLRGFTMNEEQVSDRHFGLFLDQFIQEVPGASLAAEEARELPLRGSIRYGGELRNIKGHPDILLHSIPKTIPSTTDNSKTDTVNTRCVLNIDDSLLSLIEFKVPYGALCDKEWKSCWDQTAAEALMTKQMLLKKDSTSTKLVKVLLTDSILCSMVTSSDINGQYYVFSRSTTMEEMLLYYMFSISTVTCAQLVGITSKVDIPTEDEANEGKEVDDEDEDGDSSGDNGDNGDNIALNMNSFYIGSSGNNTNLPSATMTTRSMTRSQQNNSNVHGNNHEEKLTCSTSNMYNRQQLDKENRMNHVFKTTMFQQVSYPGPLMYATATTAAGLNLNQSGSRSGIISPLTYTNVRKHELQTTVT